jgi:hypothetical protein
LPKKTLVWTRTGLWNELECGRSKQVPQWNFHLILDQKETPHSHSDALGSTSSLTKRKCLVLTVSDAL